MKNQYKNYWPLWATLFIALSILPLLAMFRLASNTVPAVVFGGFGLLWVTTFFVYWFDKKRAQKGEWRTPEVTLHLFELAGGWGAAFWAQRILRHKIRKTSFQITFWLIGIFHQLFAFDFLNYFEYSKQLLNLIFQQS